VAIGADSVAMGESAVALGSGASATGDGAVAIGLGAVADQPNQVALGATASTYRFAGVASSASRNAQSGALGLLTTDAAGNLAALDTDLDALLALDDRVAGLESHVELLESHVQQQTVALDEVQRRADGGIAAAMALGGTVMPPDANFAISFNLATYRSEQGFSGSAVARVTDRVWVSGGVAGSTVKGSTGARAGVTFAW
jgi:hypothetical protein